MPRKLGHRAGPLSRAAHLSLMASLLLVSWTAFKCGIYDQPPHQCLEETRNMIKCRVHAAHSLQSDILFTCSTHFENLIANAPAPVLEYISPELRRSEHVATTVLQPQPTRGSKRTQRKELQYRSCLNEALLFRTLTACPTSLVQCSKSVIATASQVVSVC